MSKVDQIERILGEMNEQETREAASLLLSHLTDEVAMEVICGWARENGWSEELAAQLEDEDA